MTMRVKPEWLVAAQREYARYQAWLAKHAFVQPAVRGPDPFSTFHAVDPTGEVVVFYYSRGAEVSPSACMWRVP